MNYEPEEVVDAGAGAAGAAAGGGLEGELALTAESLLAAAL